MKRTKKVLRGKSMKVAIPTPTLPVISDPTLQRWVREGVGKIDAELINARARVAQLTKEREVLNSVLIEPMPLKAFRFPMKKVMALDFEPRHLKVEIANDIHPLVEAPRQKRKYTRRKGVKA